MSNVTSHCVLPTGSGPADATPGLRILVVEDEGMVAMLIEDMLIELGHEVGAIASRLDEAVRLAGADAFDFAIIDVNLDGRTSYPVAETLENRRIPFAFATGYDAQGIDARFAAVPRLAKPFLSADMAKLLSGITVAPRRATDRDAGSEGAH
ncbi:MAG: response regulator [Xanthobacteraceae bacterium]|nr:response regulator [Xanthobacteraceae bacterium]